MDNGRMSNSESSDSITLILKICLIIILNMLLNNIIKVLYI